MTKIRYPRKKKGQTNSEYVNTVFEANRQVIISGYSNLTELVENKDAPTAKEIAHIQYRFRNYVKEYVDVGEKVTSAVKKVLGKEMFIPKTERLAKNFYSELKKDSDTYRLFRNFTRNEKGQFTSVDFAKFEYNGTETVDGNVYSVYTYDNKVRITMSNSPKGENQSYIRVTKI